MAIISVKDLRYSYDGKTDVINGISFDIEKGEYVALIGHNGSGKSTVAKLLMGLLEAKNGEIEIDGLKLCEENLYAIREKMGIVFQNPDNQFIGSTVRDDIAFGLENHQVPSENMEEIVETYATKVGLSQLMDKEPSALSGGQKQRVAIAGVLAMKPDILIFDEATSMLDPRGRKDIKAIMNDIHGEKDFTIISITHDIEEVMQADRCIVLNKGSIYMEGDPKDVFSNATALRKIGLEIPFVMQVKEAMEKRKIRTKKTDLDGLVEELWQYSLKK